MQCESINVCGLVAVRLNGVVSIYDQGSEQPIKQVTDNNTPLEQIVKSFFYSTKHFYGSVNKR